MSTGAMRCSCCGRWRVRAVVLSRDPRATLPLLRLTHCGYLVGEYNSPGDVAAVLAAAGVNLADLVDEASPASARPAPPERARVRPVRTARRG